MPPMLLSRPAALCWLYGQARGCRWQAGELARLVLSDQHGLAGAASGGSIHADEKSCVQCAAFSAATLRVEVIKESPLSAAAAAAGLEQPQWSGWPGS